MTWSGVWPASTTPFDPDGRVDLPALESHLRFLLDHGCDGVVVLGSLGEGASLSRREKEAVLQCAVRASGDPRRVLAAVGATSTAEAVEFAREAQRSGVGGLMALPPYVYHGSPEEIQAYFDEVLEATKLPVLLYNNPPAYGCDVPPELVEVLASHHRTLSGVKESSGDIRRFAELRRAVGDRLDLFVGIDDQVLEGVRSGANGWIAGLANALPAESVELFRLAREGPAAEAEAYWRWFLPLLRLDAGPRFVQLIKLVEAEIGVGHARVRPPRRPIEGRERDAMRTMIHEILAQRPGPVR